MSDVRYEEIPIKLPIDVRVIARLAVAIDREWPGAIVVTEHKHGPGHMVIRVEMRDDDWDDDGDG